MWLSVSGGGYYVDNANWYQSQDKRRHIGAENRGAQALDCSTYKYCWSLDPFGEEVQGSPPVQ